MCYGYSKDVLDIFDIPNIQAIPMIKLIQANHMNYMDQDPLYLNCPNCKQSEPNPIETVFESSPEFL